MAITIYHKCLGKFGYIVRKDSITKEEEKSLLADLTVKTTVLPAYRAFQKPKIYKIYFHNTLAYFMPRFYGMEKFGTAEYSGLTTGAPVTQRCIFDPLKHQLEALRKAKIIFDPAKELGDGGVLSLPCGYGKCLGVDTQILMYDGTVRLVQDIVVGDQLMGDDSKPRNVQELARGREMMYKIRPDKGDPYVVNESHILSLQNNKGVVIDISVRDYLGNGTSLRGYRVPVEFPRRQVPNDPYTVGYWLGHQDGAHECVPHIYKCNDRETQLAVLAGCIDAYGSKGDDVTRFDLVLNSKQLCDDVIFIARSLGYVAYNAPSAWSAFRIIIDGNDLTDIPTVLYRASVRTRGASVEVSDLSFDIKVEQLQVDDYYGFQIDGNRRFLLGDFQVTHNTYCAIKIAADYLKLAALIVVPTECLMDQWIDAIKTFLPNARVGYIQRDHVDIQDKDFVVAMLHSLSLKNYPLDIFNRFGITIFDECHHMASASFTKAMMKTRTRFMLGLSATPKRSDGLSHVFYKFLGPLFHKEKRTGSNVVYIKKIRLDSNSENYQPLHMVNGTINTAGMTTAIAKLVERNILIVHLVRELIHQGRKILVLSSRKDHLHTIKDMLDAEGIKHPVTGKYITYGFYYGKKGMTRVAHKALLKESSKCDVVLGISQIAREGLDIPDLNALIFVTPAGMEVEQPVGRILRKFHKLLNPLVIDLVDNTGNYVKHSRERDKWYKEEDYIIQEDHVQLVNQPDLWRDEVTSFIQQKQPTPKPTRKEPAKEPEFNDCFLQMPGDAVPTASPSTASKASKARIRIKPHIRPGRTPSMNNCLLSDNSAILPKAPPSSARTRTTEPNFDGLMI